MAQEQHSNPLISVIIPCYNYGHLLGDTLKNIQQQTYNNWECIVVDDESTDNTAQVVSDFSKSDSRIKYIYQKNSGPSVARNLGLKNSKGNFIQFLDADDLLENKKFETQIAVFDKKTNCGIVYSNVKYFKDSDSSVLFNDITLEGSKPWMKKVSGSGDNLLLPLLKGNIMVIHSPLIKKTVFDSFGVFNELLRYNEDWELWTRFAMNNVEFIYDESEKTQALVRVHESYSKDNFMMFIYGLQVCEMLREKLKAKRYKRILLPKINYHKRIIDEKLVATLRNDRNKAIEWTSFLSIQLKSIRYKLYNKLFLFLPTALCSLVAKLFFITVKIKNTLVYGA
jgi:glycosyltransferase involved in cell wall biosynthesis